MSVGYGPRQLVDAMLEAKAFRFELEHPRVALGKNRLDLFSQEARAFCARVQERANSMHEVRVVGGHKTDYVQAGGRRTMGHSAYLSGLGS